MKSAKLILFFGLFIALGAHAWFSIKHRDLVAEWSNVPPVPSKDGAAMFALGDKQLGYRMTGTMIQNMGDTGGKVTPLHKYDYERLGQWFFLMDYLDPKSNYIPLLAAYYYGATQKPEQLDPLIEYLAEIGERPYDEKWRWLAQAAYLSRFRQNDLEKALGYAYKLRAMGDKVDLPVWAQQMPAIISGEMGDKDTAYNLTVALLKDEHEKLHPAEVNFLVSYICERVLDESRAAEDPLCQNYE